MKMFVKRFPKRFSFGEKKWTPEGEKAQLWLDLIGRSGEIKLFTERDLYLIRALGYEIEEVKDAVLPSVPDTK